MTPTIPADHIDSPRAGSLGIGYPKVPSDLLALVQDHYAASVSPDDWRPLNEQEFERARPSLIELVRFLREHGGELTWGQRLDFEHRVKSKLGLVVGQLRLEQNGSVAVRRRLK